MDRRPIIMRSQEKPVKNNKLNLQWDKDEQSYLEQQELGKTEQRTKRNVEEYLEFLSDILPTSAESLKDRIADKQFTL